MFKRWFYNSGVHSNRLVQAYWSFRIWWMNNASDPWRQFKFDSAERYKSTMYSIKVLKWHKPCIECWGSKTSVKYRQEQPCRLGCGVGYQRVSFLRDMKYIFYPNFKIYNFKCWLKETFLGCSKSDPHIWHKFCRYGTEGCGRHPRTHDWKGDPLTSKLE